jgi:hypothetical protein
VATERIGIKKSGSVLGQSPDLKPKVFVCFGRPDFLPDAVKKAAAHAQNGVNYKLIPVCVLAEMYVRFKEGKLNPYRVQQILEIETGYIDIKRI